MASILGSPGSLEIACSRLAAVMQASSLANPEGCVKPLPGATWLGVKPGVCPTPGQAASCEARGRPHPPPCPGYRIQYTRGGQRSECGAAA